ncbi:MAG: hypothetical protein K2X47_11025 [Bdellovibrionales bacterium]|nr:hypothetical protein [Bdellovibrionales bacterium]
MKFLELFLFIATFALAQVSPAAPLKRTVTLEWEEVPESSSYQIEITRRLSTGKQKPTLHKTTTATWSAPIEPGHYEMRIRSFDDRDVAGEWSDPVPFSAVLPAGEMIKPKPGDSVKSKEAKEAGVEFRWATVEGADGYRVELFDADGKSLKTTDHLENKTRLNLEVARTYRWKVTPMIGGDPSLGETPDQPAEFSLLGKKIPTPNPERPNTRFVTEVEWATPEFAKTYSYKISRKTKNGKWQVIQNKKGETEPKATLDPNAPGGTYKLEVKSHAPLREDSETASIEFSVYEGKRTPAAIESAMLRESIENERGRYVIASYLISNLNYLGRNRELGPELSYTALGGTGRLGYGYMPRGKWGIVGTGDMSGVLINNKNYTFASADVQAIWRTYIREVTQIRVMAGLFAKQIPEAKGLTRATVEVDNIFQAGPSFGIQVWHPFSYKLGLQVNASGSMGMIGLSTPNGKPISTTLSYQLGLLGSYKLSSTMTGLLGYAYRVDKAAYQATPYSGGGEANFASAGDINEVTMSGSYLNLYLEWGF